MNKKSAILVSLIWTSLIAASVIWNCVQIFTSTETAVSNKARSFFDQILVTRTWNASHGSVYVPETDKTKPNPYLTDPQRDVVTLNGLKLTMINPAYMTRQIAEINKAENDLQFHITSLNPIRPANKADEWEARALHSFVKGNKEVMELVTKHQVTTYRYMAPLVTAKACLKCHAAQGYKVGDIRGGISIAFPAVSFKNSEKRQITYLSIAHLLIFLVGLFGIIRYFSVNARAEARIREQNHQLMKINKDKDRLFSIVAHDIRSPFNYFLGLTKVLDEEFETLKKEEVQEIASRLRNSASNMFRFLDNLLEWSRIQINRIDPDPGEWDLLQVVMQSKAILEDIIKKKDIRIEVSIPEATIIHTDKNMLQTILINLINNAVKFSHQGGIVEIFATVSNGQVKSLGIRDFGIGMSARLQQTLFDDESSAGRPGTAGEPSTGLGLQICKELMSRLGGSITVNSKEQQGTLFLLTFPFNNQSAQHDTMKK